MSRTDQDFFVDRGWSPAQSQGIVTNLMRESGGDPTNVGDGGLAYGVAQWRPDRQANFAKWAGHDIRQSTREEQLAFVDYELRQGAETRAGKLLASAQTPEQAEAVVRNEYERPAGSNPSAVVADLGLNPQISQYIQGQIANQRSIQEATAPILKGMQEDITKDRAIADKTRERLAAEPVNLPEWKTPAPVQDPMKNFGSLASIFALAASAFTKTPMVSSINALAAVNDAVKKKDWEGYKSAYDAWKANTDIALKRHDILHQEYEDAMKLMPTDIAAAQAKIQAIAAQYGDGPMAGYNSHGLFQDMVGLQESRDRNAILLQRQSEAMRTAPTNMQWTAPDGTKQSGALSYDRIARRWVDSSGMPVDGNGFIKVGTVPQEEKTQLSSATIDAAAEYYFYKHVLPPGYKAHADQVAIENRMMELHPEAAKGGNWASAVAGTTSASSALTQVTKQASLAKSFSDATLQEFDLAIRLFPEKLSDADSQLINKWRMTGSKQFGDTTVPPYMTALISALDEYAKVLSGSTGAAGSTDTSRNQAASLISEGSTKEQLVKTVEEAIKPGIKYKVDSYEDARRMLQDEIGGGGAQPSTTDSTKSPFPEYPGAMQKSDGHWYVEKDGKKYRIDP